MWRKGKGEEDHGRERVGDFGVFLPHPPHPPSPPTLFEPTTQATNGSSPFPDDKFPINFIRGKFEHFLR